MSVLAKKKCIPCQGGGPTLNPQEAGQLLEHLHDWIIEGAHHLRKAYTFADFTAALAFVNEVGRVAEEEGHHPDIQLGWGKVIVKIWTHKVDGLTENDFILAAKIDQIQR